MDRAEADRLAIEIAQSPEGFRRLVESAAQTDPPAADLATGSSRGEPRPIQVWAPESIDGALWFTRPAPEPLGDHHASRRRIRAAKEPGVLRICLFGESVAAGYLYAPWLTPAGLLQDLLDAGAGPGRYEVIDLARTNETLDGMQTAMRASLQLDPDIFIVFAGNNWTLLETQETSPHAPDARARHVFGKALAEEGLFGPVERALRLRLERAGKFMAAAAGHSREEGIRVITVVPEVNLADWADWGPIPWLPGDGSARWHALLGQACVHLKEGAWAEAFAAGEALLALDGGASAVGFQVLAWAKEGQGERAKAARAARAAVDALHYPLMVMLGSPRAVSTDQDLVRAASQFHGFDLVDLPELFAAWTGDPFPGRRMFLDYCHLTTEGMLVAAAGIAAKLQPGRTWRDLAASAPAPALTPAQDAAAKFGAALHTAHRMPSSPRRREVLEYWIEAALAADTGAAERMIDLAEARAAGRWIELTPAHAHNLSAEAPVLYAHGWDYPHLDAAALEAVLAVLSRRGSPGAVRIDAALAGAGLPAGNAVELTRPYHLAEPLDRPFHELAQDGFEESRAILRSYRPEIAFVFLSDGRGSRPVRVCARLPAAARDGRVRIDLNGVELEPLALGAEWRAVERELPVAALKPGINRLRLVWPAIAGDGREALQAAVVRLLEGVAADLFPVFGELYSVRLAAIT